MGGQGGGVRTWLPVRQEDQHGAGLSNLRRVAINWIVKVLPSGSFCFQALLVELDRAAIASGQEGPLFAGLSPYWGDEIA